MYVSYHLDFLLLTFLLPATLDSLRFTIPGLWSAIVSEVLESSSDDDDTRLNMDCRRCTDDSELLVVTIFGDVGGGVGMKDIRDWR